jgi:hypothetical protein
MIGALLRSFLVGFFELSDIHEQRVQLRTAKENRKKRMLLPLIFDADSL